MDRRQASLRLALPWLTAPFLAGEPAGGAPPRARHAEWLVARGRLHDRAVSDWRRWLLARVPDGERLLQDFPAGPCSRALATGEPAVGVWACARPVHLLTAIDNLQLAPWPVELDEAEASALVADANRHFAEQGLRLHGNATGQDWHLECAQAVECECVEPAAAAGHNLRELMPAGRDGAHVRAFMNELQMLLHAHPVNAVRADKGLPVVNSLWLWGFGRAAKSSAARLPPLFADDPWLAGIWRLHESVVRPIEDFSALDSETDIDSLLAWSRRPADEARTALAQVESVCTEAARRWLGRRRAREVDLLVGEHWVATGPGAWLRFWRPARPLHAVFPP